MTSSTGETWNEIVLSSLPVHPFKMAVLGRLNQLEYFLQGSIEKKSVQTLLHRLKGLCDKASERLKRFSDREMVYSLGRAFARIKQLSSSFI